MAHTVLRIDASARSENSESRALTQQIVDRFEDATVISRDLGADIPLIDTDWLTANFTPEADRTAAQNETLELSDAFITELQQADVIVIGAPIYNFSIPSTLKAWVDQVARAGITFRYTENGPVGLLEGKRAIVAYTSGGTQLGSEIDFASGYLRHILGFIGIKDVEFVAADQLAIDADVSRANARDQVTALAA